ncbi:MAG: hypothetical protein V1663_03835, partial [archaeon]
EYAPIFYSPDDHPSDEACLAMLKHAMTALKDDGCLIIAIENKFGFNFSRSDSFLVINLINKKVL